MIELCCDTYLYGTYLYGTYLYLSVVSTYLYGTVTVSVECGFTLKLVRDMIKTYNQMHRTDNYSQHSSIIWPVWLNG